MLADEPTFLTLPEAADILEVSRTSVRRWVKQGRLRSIKLPSGHRRIRREDVERILSGDTAVEDVAV
jgi:putative resolvase